MKKKLRLLIILLILIIALSIFWYMFENRHTEDVPSIPPVSNEAPTIVDDITLNPPSPEISQGNNLNDKITNYLASANISSDNISIYVYNFETKEAYSLNQDTYFTAASVYKLPLAMLYYEAIQNGEYTFSSELLYSANCYEYGGPIGDYYVAGDYIDLNTLLYDMILYSDNTAAHILFENLGGWVSFKNMASKYSNMEYDPIFFSGDNVLNAQYMHDVLSYLYEHPDTFKGLVEDMKNAMPNDYLNHTIHNITAQKYGSFDTALNSSGIVYEGIPYSITIFTDLGYDANVYLGDINQLCYAYFNAK